MNDTSLTWQKSSHSTSSGTCVEVASYPDGRVLARNSNAPEAGTLACSRAAMSAWITACREGELDDLSA
jgi:hypothetical protein